MEQLTEQDKMIQNQNLKFCKHCGEKIPMDAIVCVKCGRQVEELKNTNQQPNIVINNDNSSKNANLNANTNVNKNNMGGYGGKPKNKTIALLLCLFLGCLGAHKFYEEKPIMGIIYIFTAGLLFVGVIIDLLALIFKPSTYYV